MQETASLCVMPLIGTTWNLASNPCGRTAVDLHGLRKKPGGVNVTTLGGRCGNLSQPVASRGILEGVGKPEAEALSVHTLCGHQALAGKPPRTTRCTGALLNIAKGSEGFRAKHTHQSQDTWRIIPVSKGKVTCKQLW